MVREVINAGASQEEFFGYPVKTDGLYLQQDPEEFGALVHFLATQAKPAALSMDIGIASGGQTKFIRDYYRCDKTIIVDNGEHELFPHWERIKPTVNTEIVLERIENSHNPGVREALKPYFGQVDFAFVDGDHSYRGLRQDIFLTKLVLKPGGLMVLHDTAAVWDCKRVFDDLIRSRDFTLVRNFQNRFGISVWKLLRVKRPPSAWNHFTGLGRI